MQSLGEETGAFGGYDVVRFPGSYEVIRPSDADADDWERFPRGLLHLIGTDGPDGMTYEIRVRTHNGMLYVMPFKTTDFAEAREEIAGFRGTLALTYDDTKGIARDDPAEVKRGMEFELACGINHRARIESGAYDPCEVVPIKEFDGEDEERFPHAYLIPLALGLDDKGSERFGVAMSWLGQMVQYRTEDLDYELTPIELRAQIEKRQFIEVFNDPNECKAALLFAMAENIYLWGRHVARSLPEHAGRPEWGPLPASPLTASHPGQAGR